MQCWGRWWGELGCYGGLAHLSIRKGNGKAARGRSAELEPLHCAQDEINEYFTCEA